MYLWQLERDSFTLPFHLLLVYVCCYCSTKIYANKSVNVSLFGVKWKCPPLYWGMICIHVPVTSPLLSSTDPRIWRVSHRTAMVASS